MIKPWKLFTDGYHSRRSRRVDCGHGRISRIGTTGGCGVTTATKTVNQVLCEKLMDFGSLAPNRFALDTNKNDLFIALCFIVCLYQSDGTKMIPRRKAV